MTSITQDWKAGTPAPGWRDILRPEFAKPYMQSLIRFLDEDRVEHTIFPEPKNIFRAYAMTDYPDVTVVILGQDPYHGPRQANGLCFSVWDEVPVPPSLINIYKEIEADLGGAAVPERQPGSLGEAGRLPAEHGADGAARRGELAPRQGVGALHRADHRGAFRARGADGLHALGAQRTGARGAHRRREAPDPQGRAPRVRCRRTTAGSVAVIFRRRIRSCRTSAASRSTGDIHDAESSDP
jgi:hypothetical protein